MAVMINAACMHGEEVRLVEADHVACAIDEKLVCFRLDAYGDVAHVLFGDFLPKLVRAARPFVGGFLRIVRPLRPVFGQIVVDVRMVGGDRPEGIACDFSKSFSDSERIWNFDALRPPIPRNGFQHARMEFEIVDDAVLVWIATAHHADMGRIGDGRIDGAHALHHGTMLEELAETCVVLQEVFDVFPDHGVAGENNDSV